MSTAAIVGGTIAGGVIGAVGSNMAAGTQAGAANQAAQLQYQESQNALDWQKQMFGIQENLAMPWINTGTNSLNTLARLFGMPNPSGTPASAAPPSQSANALGLLPGGGRGVLNNGGDSIGGDGGPMPIQGNNAAFNRMAMMNGASPNGGGAQFNPNVNEGAFPNPDASTFGAGVPNRIPSVGGQGGPPTSGQLSIDPNFQPPPNMNGQPPTTTASGTGAQATVPGTGGSTAAMPGANPTLGVTDPNSYFQPFQNWTQQFQAPTNVTEQNDPGYQFRLDQGMKALQNSAAAKGTLLTGGTAKDITDFGQQDASNEYGNVYNRALGEYQQNYNIFQNQQTGQFNRLMALAGMGQTGTGQLSSAAGQSGANIGNTFMQTGAQIGQNINNAGAARASGYVGGANAISSGLSNLGNLALLYKMYNNNQPAPQSDPGVPA